MQRIAFGNEGWRMEWCAAGVLVVVAVALPFAIRDSWHSYRCISCRTARHAVRDRHLDWQVLGSTHRATEPGRDVVAVFYQQRANHRRPSPYLLVAVARESGATEELPTDGGSPYAFKGRK